MKNTNITLERLRDNDKITQAEYELLLSDKSNWNSEDTNFDEAKDFWEVFSRIKDILDTQDIRETLKLSPHDSLYNFTYLKFPDMDSSPIYEEYIYPDYANEGHVYTKDTDFSHCTFYGITNFKNTIFNDEVKFNNVNFIKATDFSETSFEEDTYFKNAKFQDTVTFENSECKGIFDFSDTAFSSLLLDKSSFPNASYLRLNGYDKETYRKEGLSYKHLKTKETARIIKAHFDAQNNITEANKYFPIEQELYLNTIYSQESIIPNKNSTLFVLLLNKFVNYFGTDWVRSLLILFMLSYLFMRFYIDFDSFLGVDKNIKHFTEIADIQYIWTMFISWALLYLSTFYKANKLIFWSLIFIGIVINIIGITSYDNVLAMQNYIIQLTNPINAFKNMNLYEGIEIYGAFVRIIIVTIIYQFLVAFRQNTRRK